MISRSRSSWLIPLRKRARWLAPAMLLLAGAVMALSGCSGKRELAWDLNPSIQGHYPDLKFKLTDGAGHTVTQKDYRGKVALLYFGYTHCPDVCPLTMTHLHMALQKLGPRARDARILFVTVDPARDTPAVLHKYVKAFDQHAVGLTGTQDQIKHLAKRYRVAFNRGKSDGHGGYTVNHGAAIYIFDGQGHARLLGGPKSTPKQIAHDVGQLISLEHRT